MLVLVTDRKLPPSRISDAFHRYGAQFQDISSVFVNKKDLSKLHALTLLTLVSLPPMLSLTRKLCTRKAL